MRLPVLLERGESRACLLATAFVVLISDEISEGFNTSRKALSATLTSDARTPTERRISVAEFRVARIFPVRRAYASIGSVNPELRVDEEESGFFMEE